MVTRCLLAFGPQKATLLCRIWPAQIACSFAFLLSHAIHPVSWAQHQPPKPPCLGGPAAWQRVHTSPQACPLSLSSELLDATGLRQSVVSNYTIVMISMLDPSSPRDPPPTDV